MERIQKPVLDLATATRISELALDGIKCEYPNALERFSDEEFTPRTIHPAFYGCYDWHSAVHSHWTLVRLLKAFPALPLAAAIRSTLESHLTAENIRAEVANFGKMGQPVPDNWLLAYNLPGQPGFEKPYGWAWLLQLASELASWNDSAAQKWLANLQPLAQRIVELYLNFLAEPSPPNREGQHQNTAFGLSFALDYARVCGHTQLEEAIKRYALHYFAADTDYSAQNEPGGTDFFSPALIEADLMGRVLASNEFTNWFNRFLPGTPGSEPASLLQPVNIPDHSDPFVSHLDGLNFSRAWCLYNIALRLPEGDKANRVLVEAAHLHATEGLAHLFSGDFSSTGHWLGTFAVYLLSGVITD